ncbi:MAG: hypothetical protein LBU39_01045 [Desulfobulbaceae bacterium]|jgi:hypothetical protein|nr:hypothetical protein [Desulfobulbaceae bacterium]
MKTNYEVIIKRRVQRDAEKMPKGELIKWLNLVDDLAERGPALGDWPNYSKLGKNEYHCHLSYRWVACWRHQAETIEIEVYYVGSRENAPY